MAKAKDETTKTIEAPKAAPPPAPTKSAHERLAAGGFKDGLLRVDPEIQDDELLGDKPLFLLVGAVERRAPQAGSTIAKAMEVWHAMAELSPGKWIPRTIRGRAHLSKCLLGQVAAHGLCYLRLGTGELAHLPGPEGAYAIVTRDAQPAIVGCFVRIDKTKGRAANKGQRYTYLVDGNGRTLREALELLPELPLSPESTLALGLDDSEPDVE